MQWKLIFLFLAKTTCSLGQVPSEKCRYPIGQSADSIVKFVIKDIYSYSTAREVNGKFGSDEFRNNFYNSSLNINYDSVFQACFSYTRALLGNSLLCNNVDLYINSFYVSKEKNEFQLSLGFTYPILKRDEPIRIGNFTSYYERANFVFNYVIDKNGKVTIKYPANIPDCKGKSDCGIVVTRQKMVAILNNKGLVKVKDIIIAEVYGLYWYVSLSNDNWSSIRYVTVDIKSGEVSNVTESRRID